LKEQPEGFLSVIISFLKTCRIENLFLTVDNAFSRDKKHETRISAELSIVKLIGINMDEYKYISRFDIEEKLTGQHFKINIIISSALLMGTFIFLLIVILMYHLKEGGTPEQQSLELIDIMIIVFCVITLSVYLFVGLFPKIFLRRDNIIRLLKALSIQEQDKNDAPEIRLIGIDRTLMIIRLAMMESVTLFGSVILMLAVLDSVIYSNEALWFLALPFLVQLLFTINNYFSKEKAVERIYYTILQKVSE
jgi:hypothetical protein